MLLGVTADPDWRRGGGGNKGARYYCMLFLECFEHMLFYFCEVLKKKVSSLS